MMAPTLSRKLAGRYFFVEFADMDGTCPFFESRMSGMRALKHREFGGENAKFSDVSLDIFGSASSFGALGRV